MKRLYYYYNNNVLINDKYDVLKRISENIEDLKGRYLLVISKPSISEFLFTSIIKDKNKKFNYYKGSPFIDDLKSEEYNLKILNKVQYDIGQDKVIILDELEKVYSNLNDLFRQNFFQFVNKNYTTINLGNNQNFYSFVNTEFRCIINIGKDKIKKEDPPFLNSFEKHIISFENILKKDELDKSKEIYEKLLEMIEKNDEDELSRVFNYNLKEIIINLSLDEIHAYIYKLKKLGSILNNTRIK